MIPIIIYDGPENSGKTTIKRIVNELLEHKSISFERWTGTQFAYALLHKRKFDIEEILDIDRKMDACLNPFLVYLYAKSDDMLERKNWDPIEDPKYKLKSEQINELVHHFFGWYDITPIRRKVCFNTSNSEAKYIAKAIADWVKKEIS